MTITVGLAGITGKFAAFLAVELLRNPEIVLRGYARDPRKLHPSLSCLIRVQLFQGGASDDAKISSFVDGCDVVICAYNGNDNALMIDGQKKLIDACEEAGVARYIASDWCLDYTKLQTGQLPPKDPMRVIKAYLETKTTVKGVHIFNGGFMEYIASPMFGLWDAEAPTLHYYGDGTEPMEGTSFQTAAEYTAAVVADPFAVGILRCKLSGLSAS
jgi:hypothetical protein